MPWAKTARVGRSDARGCRRRQRQLGARSQRRVGVELIGQAGAGEVGRHCIDNAEQVAFMQVGQRMEGDVPIGLLLEGALGRGEEAREVAETSLTTLTRAKVKPEDIAEAQFVVAESLADGKPTAPPRAVALAEAALAVYAAGGPGSTDEAAAIERWLEKHR